MPKNAAEVNLVHLDHYNVVGARRSLGKGISVALPFGIIPRSMGEVSHDHSQITGGRMQVRNK